MESSLKAILVTSYVSVQVFPSFLQKVMHTYSSIFFIIQIWWWHCTLPLFIWDHMRLREARVRVLAANRSRHVRTYSKEAVSLGANSYWRANNSPGTFCMYFECSYPEVSWLEFCMNLLFDDVYYIHNQSLNSTKSQIQATEVHNYEEFSALVWLV
jgi:hypothetical protein